jgi:hypothetical protein
MIAVMTINIKYILNITIGNETGYTPSAFLVRDGRKRIVKRFITRNVKLLSFGEVGFRDEHNVVLLQPELYVFIF